MMMETVVYSREYLFAKELYDRGELGAFSFCAAAISRTTTRTCFPSPFADSRSPRRFKTPTICRFFRAEETVVRIRTSSTIF
jgi:hypothetical protein